MHVVNRRAARVAARCLVVPLAALPLLFAARPASAHTELVTRSPAEAASESRPPQSVELTFSDEMTSRYAKVALTSPDGEQAAAGAPRVEGRTVTLPVKPGLPAGSYTVGYRVVSADGHPVAGSYRFTVEGAAAGPATPAPSDPSSTPAPSPTPAPSRRPAENPSRTGATSTSGTASSSGTTSSTGVPALPVVIGGLLLLTAAGVCVAVIRQRRVRHGS
ncbi:copper resistance protein CopC [Streptomyces sp. NBC_00838]|uniref:copper resistance CopC family protein n=1 Tax=Streptomyces sp. NBC_00838 TaxID=2903680 RepID=UPI003865FFAB|nr:copper resistance protein CopC [Streptomyces sp. NBC_00838]